MNKRKTAVVGFLILAVVVVGVFLKIRDNESVESKKTITCSLSVECISILENPQSLNPDKKDIIPQDGIIFKNDSVTLTEGENAFDVLKRELTENKIHFEFSKTSGYDSMYVEGIANIYQLDCGDVSGWLYYVNGESPTVSADQYIVKENDMIEWKYSVNMLEDF